MGLMIWLEGTQLGDYMRVSANGYPWMLTLHSIGLALMVGLSSILSLRVLGLFTGLPREVLPVFLAIAWAGFVVNVVSGFSIFAMQATIYAVDREFLLKITFVVLGALFVALLQWQVTSDLQADADGAVSPRVRSLFALAVLISWAVAMTFGRLIAYL